MKDDIKWEHEEGIEIIIRIYILDFLSYILVKIT
jgi:hypothetical protein